MQWEPQCLLSTKDYTLLEVALNRAIAAGAPIVPMLRRKLSRAIVIFRQDIPSNVVTMNSRVLYRVGAGQAESRILVHGEESDVVGLTIPVTTPRGLALLGMSTGEETTYERPDGVHETIAVDDVAYQPEAAERQARDATAARLGQNHAAPPRAPVVISFTARRGPSPWPIPGRNGDDPGPTAA